ncbi:hypothetical protein IE077_003084, partial [Cardiosporidium cionae]
MAWMLRTELELLLANLSERLDFAKQWQILQYSADLQYALEGDSCFLHFFEKGKSHLIACIDETIPNEEHYLSKYIRSAICACVIDDVNLAHVANLLRIEEILEGFICDLPISLLATILTSIIGELAEAQKQIETQEAERVNAEETALFIESTLHQLMSLIIETGRDRATYIKEAVISPPITPPRPSKACSNAMEWKRELLNEEKDIFGLSQAFASDLDGIRSDSPFLQTLYASYRRGDSVLESFLLSGSIYSLTRRLFYLYALHQSSPKELIRWSLIRQLPRLNRY